MTEHDKDAQLAQYRLKLEQTADLVARIRHEINNPLTGVLGQAQLLLREELSERSRKRVKTIEDLALRLRDVVGQLREVQKPVGGWRWFRIGELMARVATEGHPYKTRLSDSLIINRRLLIVAM